MNKVKQRCENPACAKFLYASNAMYLELKIIKLFLYALNIIPVVICFMSTDDVTIKALCSLVSFALTLISEASSQILSNYKEKAILEKQIYESEITGSTFSKIEYDRESTNDMQELAIRKGMFLMNKAKKKAFTDVPEEISDDYSYLYIARQSAAKNRFLLSRQFYFYLILLILVGVGLVSAISLTEVSGIENSTTFSFYYVICFWPLIIPLIRNLISCQKGMKQCVKICADIDNYFADGDDSIERLARFYYYVQNIEFEMLLVKPIVFVFIEKMHKKQLKVLLKGVTIRFKEAINELKSKKYISQPKGKGLITKVDYDLDALMEKEKLQRQKKKEEEKIKKDLERKKEEERILEEKKKQEALRKEALKRQEIVMSKSVESIDIKKTTPKKDASKTKKVEKISVPKKDAKASAKNTKAKTKPSPTKPASKKVTTKPKTPKRK